MNYQFQVGQRVTHRYEGWVGEVTSVVPGNGSLAWYYVQWDHGSEDSYMAHELEAL